MRYEGPSPDEICLVSAARQQDFVYLGSSDGASIVQILNENTELPKLFQFEFDNKRKMMSVIIEQELQGKKFYKLLLKGADSAVLSRLGPMEQPFLKASKAQLEKCSKFGLRTLCMAMRVLSEEEMQQIKAKNLEISTKMNKEALLDEFLATIEKDLFLLGCSAVEDRLQDEVPETIHKLLQAGIKVWMLTGDKMETAENIGLSCKLIWHIIGISGYRSSTPTSSRS